MLVIYGIKVGDSYYITTAGERYQRQDLKAYYFFDGENPVKSFDDNWFVVNNPPTNIITKKPQPDINHRYCLIDDTLESENRPLEITREEACYQAPCGDWVWKDEYAQYKSLYVIVSDKQPILDVEVEFEWHDIGVVEAFNEPIVFNYPEGRVWRSHSSAYQDGYVRRGNIQHQDIDKAIFPSFVLHTKPCKLPKEKAYAIIREHVKTHIDPRYARVSSDYDFTFTVMKRISLAKPYESTKTYKPPYKRKSITQTTMNKVREQITFNMEAKNSTQFANVPEFEGKDEEELKSNIDSYLEQLMEEINAPIAECSHCNGTGVEHSPEDK